MVNITDEQPEQMKSTGANEENLRNEHLKQVSRMKSSFGQKGKLAGIDQDKTKDSDIPAGEYIDAPDTFEQNGIIYGFEEQTFTRSKEQQTSKCICGHEFVKNENEPHPCADGHVLRELDDSTERPAGIQPELMGDMNNDPTSGMTEENLFAKMRRIQEESDRKRRELDEDGMDKMKKAFQGYDRPKVCSDDKSMIPSISIRTRELFYGDPKYRTFGQKTMGVTYKPSNHDAPMGGSWEDDRVFRLSMLYAEIIDILNDFRAGDTTGEQKRLASIAITEAEGAEMWAVKAVTWKD